MKYCINDGSPHHCAGIESSPFYFPLYVLYSTNIAERNGVPRVVQNIRGCEKAYMEYTLNNDASIIIQFVSLPSFLVFIWHENEVVVTSSKWFCALYCIIEDISISTGSLLVKNFLIEIGLLARLILFRFTVGHISIYNTPEDFTIWIISMRMNEIYSTQKIPSLPITTLSMFDVNTSSYFMVVALLLIFFVVLYPWINIINFFSILLLCDVYTIYVVTSYNSRTSAFKSGSY